MIKKILLILILIGILGTVDATRYMSPFNMTGAIGMDGQPLQGLPFPVNQGDAVSKAITDAMNVTIAGSITSPLEADLNANSKNITNLNNITFDANGQDIDLNGRRFTDSANGTVATDLMTVGQTNPAIKNYLGSLTNISIAVNDTVLIRRPSTGDLKWVNSSAFDAAGAAAGAVDAHELAYDHRYHVVLPVSVEHDSTSPVDLVVSTPDELKVIAVTWIPTEDFNGDSSTIDIGEGDDHSAFMADAIITKTVAEGSVVADLSMVYTESIDIRCWITPGEGCTQGAGKIVVEYADMHW